MKDVSTSPSLTKQTISNRTSTFKTRFEVDELPHYLEEDLLSEPNCDNANQTIVPKFNGTSEALRVNPGEFLPYKPPLPTIRQFFQALQKWEGYVVDIGADTFKARIIPIIGGGPDQEAEIYIEEVDSDDRELIKSGAVFYWSIGYRDRPAGRIRESILRFRRLPVWTKQELENADSGVDKLRNLLNE